MRWDGQNLESLHSGDFVTGRFVSTYFTVILPGFHDVIRYSEVRLYQVISGGSDVPFLSVYR